MGVVAVRDHDDLTHRSLLDEMREYRRAGARLAGGIIWVEPERIRDMRIVDFLRQIPYVRDERIGAWLGRAGDINALWPGQRLTYEHRYLLAGQLAMYARA